MENVFVVQRKDHRKRAKWLMYNVLEVVTFFTQRPVAQYRIYFNGNKLKGASKWANFEAFLNDAMKKK